MKILKLPKEKLDLFASVVQQFGELHALLGLYGEPDPTLGV